MIEKCSGAASSKILLEEAPCSLVIYLLRYVRVKLSVLFVNDHTTHGDTDCLNVPSSITHLGDKVLQMDVYHA